MVPLLSCNRDISRHKSFFSIIGIENEAELLLASVNLCTTPKCRKLDYMSSTSCISGRQLEPSSPQCSIPVSLSMHKATFAKKPKAQRGLRKSGSQIVLKETGIFLPVGAGQS